MVQDWAADEELPGLTDWVRENLGGLPRYRLFECGHLSKVIGVALDDGRQVVVKVRPANPRVLAAAQIQRRLSGLGFPCPAPLASSLLAGAAVTAETLVDSDEPIEAVSPSECAETLAAAVDLAGDSDDVPELSAPLPWVGWDHGGSRLWPLPDDLRVDLNLLPCPDWLQLAASRVQARLRLDSSRPVVGHCDWEAHNFGWHAGRIAVVYDWDSLGIRSEAALAGAAAAVFPSRPGGPVAATLDESAEFLEAYPRRSGWDHDLVEIAYGAGLWVLLYNARKELAGAGGGYLDHLSAELPYRLGLAGLSAR
jgi:Phosphotransferase enzyme family